MSLSDPIADMLNRIRNAMMAGFPTAEFPASTQKEAVCVVLKREGFIADYESVDEGPSKKIRVKLKYLPDRTSVIRGMKRVSRPSLRVYVRQSDIKPVRSGLGISIVSTSKGVMTGKEARAAKVGGEIMCEVW